MYRFDREAYNQRVDWFRKARFGMFIHWGLYSIPGRGEWVRSDEQMPEAEYLPYFETFTAKDFDPKTWAKAAKEAAEQLREVAGQVGQAAGGSHLLVLVGVGGHHGGLSFRGGIG